MRILGNHSEGFPWVFRESRRDEGVLFWFILIDLLNMFGVTFLDQGLENILDLRLYCVLILFNIFGKKDAIGYKIIICDTVVILLF